jgi:MFS family permease
VVYVGVSIGSYLETYSDRYGRYKFLLIDAIITSIFGFLSCVCTSFTFFAIVRFFYGIGIGIALPLTATYITEVVPGTYRARILSLSRVYWSMGCLFACFVGWILLTHNHWRILLFILCFPSYYAIYDIIKNGQ